MPIWITRDLLSFVLSDPDLRGQIVYVDEKQPREARYAVPKTRPPAALLAQLPVDQQAQLYTHQAQAYDAAMAGRNVVLATGTNSGKTLGFLLPVLHRYYAEPASRTILIYPTKALAQDQLSRIKELLAFPEEAEVYDGDTPKAARARLRQNGRILLTNPDMLHLGILPSHENWSKWFRTLSFLVLDEMHVYRGVFGSHVGNVLRRAIRLAEWYRRAPQILAGSATIANPGEHFRNLTGQSADVVDDDGSPRGKRTVVFFNPPHVNPEKRLSPNVATSQILSDLVNREVRTLAFCRTRVSAELVGRYAAERTKPNKIETYRAGYTAKERRDIEKRLHSGKLIGLSATNAMELGVDVGQLDAVLINGYPGSISSFWQQAGRAGRGSRDGLAIYVAHDEPLEQFLIRDPGRIIEGLSESAVAHPENPQILRAHLKCAAHEKPLTMSDLGQFGADALDLAEGLDRSGELEFRQGAFVYPREESPALDVNIRSVGGDTILLMVDGEELGSMEEWRALRSAHVGAIYLHRGQTFQVTELDLDAKIARLEPASVPYYTQAVVSSIVMPQKTFKQNGPWSLCGVQVTTSVTGYRRKMLDGDQFLDMIDLDLPSQTFETVALRRDLPSPDEEEDAFRFVGGVHGVEHALLAIAPLLAGCDRGDLGSSWSSMMHDSFRPAVFIYDEVPGGVGLAEKLFENTDVLRAMARQLVQLCPCEAGCPSCLLSARCESGNNPLDKYHTSKLL